LLYTLYNALESDKIYEEFLSKIDENKQKSVNEGGDLFTIT